MLRFECAINPQNLTKIVGAILEKMKISNFFLMSTTLNFEGRSKTKKQQAGDICKGILDIECQRHWSIGLGATFGNGYTHRQRQTHTHTHFSKTLSDCGSGIESKPTKISKFNFITISNTSFTPNVIRK